MEQQNSTELTKVKKVAFLARKNMHSLITWNNKIELNLQKWNKLPS